jgi:hypothetical protein
MIALSTVVLGLNLGGLILTGIGAIIAARAVRLSEAQAIHIGVGRWVSDNAQENLKLPAVQNLLRQSRAASRGLQCVVAGTAFQALALIAPLVVGG